MNAMFQRVPVTVEYIRSKVPDGTTGVHAAQILGVSVPVARKWLRACNIGSAKRGPKPKSYAAILADLRAGITLQVIADKHGLSRQRVQKICAKLLPERLRVNRPTHRMELPARPSPIRRAA